MLGTTLESSLQAIASRGMFFFREQVMQIRLRNVQTGLYVDRFGGSTASSAEAKEFSLTSDAVHFCKSRGLHEIEIIMAFGDPPSECRIPLERALISSDKGDFMS